MRLTDAHRVMAAFALHGITVGTLYARLPEIQAALGLTEALFGLALMALPAGVILGNFAVAPLVEKLGPRLLMLGGLPVFAALTVGVALSPGFSALCLALFVFGLGLALGNLAINLEADRYEARSATRVMNRCHGWWGIGFLAASLVSAGLIELGVAPAVHFTGLAVLEAGGALLVLRSLTESPSRDGSGKQKRFAIPGRAALAIGGFAAAGIVMEGVARSWGVIYLRDALGVREALAALALPAVIGTLTLGRFLADRVVARRGALWVGRGMALLTAAGLGIIVLAPAAWVALLGFAVLGLGICVAVPLGFSAAAQQPGRPAAETMAAFALISTVLSFVGPPAFGALAEVAGFRVAMAAFLPLALLAWAFAPVLTGARK
ncbi:MFS transporter [Histidinibacterium aquaticum]|uniref:MFS transporter n=1 Tax=Histidinibacterium aquaticum TaxID=2613962 RepID=A0A5J5GKH2_9RHOB|nr:MFS transporter [Histidinibacterium aquaticum]KAA9008163.1 MFS transporter [Histidinibacterium aquaticum]